MGFQVIALDLGDRLSREQAVSAVVIKHDLTVAGAPRIGLEACRAKFDGQFERLEGVVGGVGLCATMRKEHRWGPSGANSGRHHGVSWHFSCCSTHPERYRPTTRSGRAEPERTSARRLRCLRASLAPAAGSCRGPRPRQPHGRITRGRTRTRRPPIVIAPVGRHGRRHR